MTVAKIELLVEMENITIQQKNDIAVLLEAWYRPGISSAEEMQREGEDLVTRYTSELSGDLDVTEGLLEALRQLLRSNWPMGASLYLFSGEDGTPMEAWTVAEALMRFETLKAMMLMGGFYRLTISNYAAA
jgi:hypothetical protein